MTKAEDNKVQYDSDFNDFPWADEIIPENTDEDVEVKKAVGSNKIIKTIKVGNVIRKIELNPSRPLPFA